MSEGLATYGDSQFRAVGEVHLRLAARWMVLLKVHLTIRAMKGSIVSGPALERPQLGPAEPARVSLVKPLQDGCRTQAHRRDRSAAAGTTSLSHTSANGSGLLLHLRLAFLLSDGSGPRCHFLTDLSLMAADAADACCVLPSINFCLSTTTC